MFNNKTECILFPSDPEKCKSIIVVKRISASLSLIGCLYMILVIWVYKKYVAVSFRFVLHLTIAAFLDSLSYLVGEPLSRGGLCTFEGWMLMFTGWAVLLWVTCITINLVRSIQQKPTSLLIEGIYYAVGWVLPIIMACIPLAANQYGPSGAWCWLQGTVWRFVMWYVPLFLLIIAIAIMVIYITITVNRKVTSWRGMYTPEQEAEREMLRQDVKPLRAYPLVFLICSFFPLITRIHNAVRGEGDPVYFLYIMMVLSAPFQGALNSIVFGIDPETRRQMSPRQLYVAYHRRYHARTSEIREFPEEVASAEPPPLAPPGAASPYGVTVGFATFEHSETD